MGGGKKKYLLFFFFVWDKKNLRGGNFFAGKGGKGAAHRYVSPLNRGVHVHGSSTLNARRLHTLYQTYFWL